MPTYEHGLRPCLAVAHRTRTTKAIMNRALDEVSVRTAVNVTAARPRRTVLSRGRPERSDAPPARTRLGTSARPLAGARTGGASLRAHSARRGRLLRSRRLPVRPLRRDRLRPRHLR